MIFNGRYLKAARKNAKLTQEQLAEMIGVTGVTIMRYENNLRKPSQEIFDKLVAALNVPHCMLAIGVSQKEWETMPIGLQEALESASHTLQIAARDRGIDTSLVDAEAKEEHEMKQKLASAFRKLNLQGQKEAVRSVEIIAGNPIYQRTPSIESAETPMQSFADDGQDSSIKQEKPPEG